MGFGLCFTRRISESVMIGDEVEVTVIGVENDREAVRLSIVAPKHVVVHRTEVWKRIRLEKQRLMPKPIELDMRSPRERTA